jgi:hypothetical protein
MHRNTILALGAATLAVAVAAPAALAASSPQVTVRVEGKAGTLLAPKPVHAPSGGSITRGGAPAGACPAASGAGALDVATKHRWSATWFSSLNDFEITKILGDTETTKKFYWAIWVDNKFATTGACGIKLHPGEQLLFAVDSVAHHEHPLAIRAPSHATSDTPFTVKVVAYADNGTSKPLAGARLSGGGVSAVTNGRGVVQVKTHGTGTLKLDATSKGFIRAAPVRVRVSP